MTTTIARGDGRCLSPQATVPTERLAQLARGFNLPGLTNSGSQFPDKELLVRLRLRGLTHIRVPIDVEQFIPVFDSRSDGVNEIERLSGSLQTLLALGFSVSLDVHPGTRLTNLYRRQPEAGLGQLEYLWRQLALRYSGYSPDHLFFEVLNEPPVSEPIWSNHGPRLVRLIRRYAPKHTIIYGPANYQQIDALETLNAIRDLNVVYAIHFYEPMVFTHQGLDWDDDPVRDLHDVPFPASLTDRRIETLVTSLQATRKSEAVSQLVSQLREPWTEERILGRLGRAASWAQRTGRPVIVNEFGVLGWKAPPMDRARWVKAVRRAAEMHCLGWTHWDYRDGFGFVSRIGSQEIPDPLMLAALLD